MRLRSGRYPSEKGGSAPTVRHIGHRWHASAACAEQTNQNELCFSPKSESHRCVTRMPAGQNRCAATALESLIPQSAPYKKYRFSRRTMRILKSSWRPASRRARHHLQHPPQHPARPPQLVRPHLRAERCGPRPLHRLDHGGTWWARGESPSASRSIPILNLLLPGNERRSCTCT